MNSLSTPAADAEIEALFVQWLESIRVAEAIPRHTQEEEEATEEEFQVAIGRTDELKRRIAGLPANTAAGVAIKIHLLLHECHGGAYGKSAGAIFGLSLDDEPDAGNCIDLSLLREAARLHPTIARLAAHNLGHEPAEAEQLAIEPRPAEPAEPIPIKVPADLPGSDPFALGGNPDPSVVLGAERDGLVDRLDGLENGPLPHAEKVAAEDEILHRMIAVEDRIAATVPASAAGAIVLLHWLRDYADTFEWDEACEGMVANLAAFLAACDGRGPRS